MSHVVAPHGRKFTRLLHVLPEHTDKQLITCIANRLLYWKTNFIGDHGTWVKCGPGPQTWSMLMVHTSADSHFTSGQKCMKLGFWFD